MKAIFVDAVRHALPLVPLYFYHGSVPASAPDGIRPGARIDVDRPHDTRGKGSDYGGSARGVVSFAHHGCANPGGLPRRRGGDPDNPFGDTGVYLRDASPGRLDGIGDAAGILFAGGVDGVIRGNAGATPLRSDDQSRCVGNVTARGGDLARDRQMAKAAYAAQVTLIGVYLVLAYGLSVVGRHGLFIFPALYAALLVFFDARPDSGQRIFPDLWREDREQLKLPKRAARGSRHERISIGIPSEHDL
jgi:hypothetical protein